MQATYKSRKKNIPNPRNFNPDKNTARGDQHCTSPKKLTVWSM